MGIAWRKYWGEDGDRNTKEENIQFRKGQRHLDTWVWIKFHNFLCEPKQIIEPV